MSVISESGLRGNQSHTRDRRLMQRKPTKPELEREFQEKIERGEL